MNDQILRCCKNTPKYLITYKVGSQFLVCDDCIKIPYWSRGIEDKKLITNMEESEISTSALFKRKLS